MKTSRQLLEWISEKKGWSYRRIAKELGQPLQAVEQIRHGQRCIGEEHAPLVAEWLDLDGLYILACVRAERAKRKGLKSLWERIARGATAVAVSLWSCAALELLGKLSV